MNNDARSGSIKTLPVEPRAGISLFVEPFSPRRSRAVITRAPKFYIFDVGVAGHVTGRRIERAHGAEFGRALEHLVLMELLAYRSYREGDFPVRFWRTKSYIEGSGLGSNLGLRLAGRGKTPSHRGTDPRIVIPAKAGIQAGLGGETPL